MGKEVKIPIKVEAEGSMAQLKELKKQLRETAVGSEEFKKLYNQIDDLEDKIKASKNASKDWIDTLESAGGPIGALGAGLNKLKVSTQSFGAALKATGIGLIIALVAGLTAAFSQNEGAMKKLDPIIIGFQKILNGILGALQPLIDGFLNLATQALPYVTKAFGVAYSAVMSLFQSLGKIGEAISKLLKGDFAGAWESAKQSVTGFADNYDSAMKRYEKGTTELTKKEKENLKERTDAAEKALQEKLKRLDAEQKLEEARLNKKKAIDAESAFSDEQKLYNEIKYEQLSYEAKKKGLEDKLGLYKKDSAEYKGLQAELENLDAEHISNVDKNKRELEKIHKDRGQAIVDFEVKLAADLAKLDEENAVKKYNNKKTNLDSEKAFLETQLNELLPFTENYEKLLIDLENNSYQSRINDLDEMLRTKKITQEQYQKDTERATSQHNTTLLNIEKASNRARAQEMIRLAGSIGGALASMGAESKKAAKAGIRLQEVATVGDILMNDLSAIRKAYNANPLGFGLPWSAFYAVDMIAGVAAAHMNANRQIAALESETGGGSASVGGGGGNPPSVSLSTQPLAAPQIGPNVANPQNQLSQMIGQSVGDNINTTPIKAYVLTSDVSQASQFDRRIRDASRLG